MDEEAPNQDENGPIDAEIAENEGEASQDADANLEPKASNSEDTPMSEDENTSGMNPLDVIRRRAFPGSPELRAYIDSLNEYNHEAFMSNVLYIETMRRQSQMELDSYVEFMQREERLRLARVEAATILFVFYIPPIWKRAVAELIDFFILLIIKLLVTFLILDTFSISTNIARMNISQWIENPQLAAQLSTEVALLEIPFRIIVIIYETYFSVKYAGTPGKRWMGLRVVHVRELSVMDSDVLRPLTAGVARQSRTCVRIIPATILPFRFALMRSVLKNAFVGLLMSPVCFSFIFVNQNRTGYDVMTNSMVVEYKPDTGEEGPIWN